MVLVTDCAHAGLTQIPRLVPNDTDWLILSRNNISTFQTEDVKFLSILSRLDLKDNKIKYILDDFAEYLNTHSFLIDLDISNNELKSLPRNFENAVFLKKMLLSGNRFDFQCNEMWMKAWLIDNREMIQDSNAVDCQMENGKRVPFLKLKDDNLTCASMEH